MGVARRYANDDSAAKDILQDSWVKIFKAFLNDTYKEQGMLKSWMSRVVINTALKNRDGSKAKIVSIDEAYSKRQNYNDQIIDKMTASNILKIIDKLPYPSNEVFKLFVVDQYKHKEIADVLGIAESTSRVHLTNARSIIRECFPNFQELINTK